MYATVFKHPYYHFRTWAVHADLHSFARYPLVPSRSTASLLAEKGLCNLRVVGLGVDDPVFHVRALFALYSFAPDNVRMQLFPLASPPCVVGVHPSDVVILYIGRLSLEKNPRLLVHTYSALLSTLPSAHTPWTHLIFVGDGPFRGSLQALGVELGFPAILPRQLTHRRLTEAFTSGDVIRCVVLCYSISTLHSTGSTYCEFRVAVTPRVDVVASALPVFVAETKFHESARGIRGGACVRWGAHDGPARRPDEQHMRPPLHSR
ncbi:hypothetical protein K438DRAFT_2070306 [Mycena galopus ATCC 62051]|nr:hypothetical protein K438DRAFT_2070306 [Mycena galopus ATCC 62051]